MNFCKNGIINGEVFSQYLINVYDKNYYIEPDNSVWTRISHHTPVLSDGSYNLFSSTDSFSSQVYKNEKAWFNIALCNKNSSGKWELMVKQTKTQNDNETKYRWIQNVNPMTATYEQTTPQNITINKNNGYDYEENTYGGMYYKNSSAYLVVNNSIKNNWFGATGSWNSWSNGIPGVFTVAITTGYYDVYYRVDTEIFTKCSLNKIGISSANFMEY